jgi:CHAP domain
MRSKMGWSLVWGACFIIGLVMPSRRANAANCALYARAQTGVFLYGAAGSWWDEAIGRYQRGQTPQVGSILVFRRTGRIPSGHVAVVAKIVGPGEILVDHANWHRGTVSHAMPVIDTSPNHDWTTVAAMDLSSGKHGADYPTYGFVYPETGARDVASANAGRGFNPYAAATEVGYEPYPRDGMFHFAVDNALRGHAWRHRSAGHSTHRRTQPAHALLAAEDPKTGQAARDRTAPRAHESVRDDSHAPARTEKTRTTRRKRHQA